MVVHESAYPFLRGKADIALKQRATTDWETDRKVSSNLELRLDPPGDENVRMLSLWVSLMHGGASPCGGEVCYFTVGGLVLGL